MTGNAFGFGSPFTSPTTQQTPFGLTPQWSLAPGGAPSTLPQHYGQPLQQIVQLLQTVPQQLQQLQQLQHAQQQQLQHVQHILQAVPAQLQQLQQLIQIVPQQIQQLQQQPQPPYVPSAGLGPFAATVPWGATPTFGQPGQVM
jgi:ABC-type transporter Mla subunit MlaD